MSFMDRVKSAASVAKERVEEEVRRRADEQKAREATKEVDEQRLADERHAAFARAQEECPLPIIEERVPLPGGLQLFNDEFLVTTAKDWGWSSQKLSLTTQRVIFSRGRLAKGQESCYLVDVRDVMFHKPVLGHGSLVLETAGGRSLEGLPAASNGQRVRDQLLQLIHYARQRASSAPGRHQASPPSDDRYDQLRKLAALHAEGILSDDEYAAEKAKLLTN